MDKTAPLTRGEGRELIELLDRLVKENTELRRELEKKEMDEWKRQKLERRLHPAFPHSAHGVPDDIRTGGEEGDTVLVAYLKLKVKKLESSLRKKTEENEQLREANRAIMKQEVGEVGQEIKGEEEAVASVLGTWGDLAQVEVSLEGEKEEGDDGRSHDSEDNPPSDGSSTSSQQVPASSTSTPRPSTSIQVTPRTTLHAKDGEQNLSHGEDPNFSSPDGLQVKCVCGKEYAKRTLLRQHLRRFTNNYDFECNLCHKTYKTAANLQRHSKNIHKVAAHPRGAIGCGICGKLFGVKKVYQQHMYQVHGTVTWPVNEASPGPCDLRRRPGPHGRDQSTRKDGSPRYQHIQRCLCGSGYPSRAQLNQHLAMMRPSVPFKCPHCSVEYRRHTKLALHINKVHNVQGYIGVGCNVCGTTWSDKGALIRHRKLAHSQIFQK